jgi:hypothetical protein
MKFIIVDNRLVCKSTLIMIIIIMMIIIIIIIIKVKQSLYTPWRRLGGEEV